MSFHIYTLTSPTWASCCFLPQGCVGWAGGPAAPATAHPARCPLCYLSTRAKSERGILAQTPISWSYWSCVLVLVLAYKKGKYLFSYVNKKIVEVTNSNKLSCSKSSLLECSPAKKAGSIPGRDKFASGRSSRGWRWPWSSLSIESTFCDLKVWPRSGSASGLNPMRIHNTGNPPSPFEHFNSVGNRSNHVMHQEQI